jgi:hypothetical protein
MKDEQILINIVLIGVSLIFLAMSITQCQRAEMFINMLVEERTEK